MDSRVSLVIAGLLITSAVIVGYWGLTTGQRSDVTPLEAPSEAQSSQTNFADGLTEVEALATPSSMVAVVTRDLPIYTELQASDLSLVAVSIAPPNSFNTTQPLVGRTLQAPLAAGSWISADAFKPGSALAHMIAPNERAVAISVDEIIAAGGHLRPGDHVDVLLHLQAPGNSASDRNESAQVVLQALRVLSTGANLAPQPEQFASTEDEDQAKPAGLPRSVVLAVPEAMISRLLLASQAGTLRLAVRSADEQLAAREPHTLAQLAATALPALKLSALTADADAQATQRPSQAPHTRSPRPRSIEVIRGTQSLQQTP